MGIELFSESSTRSYTFYPTDQARRCTAKDLQDALREIAKQRGVKVSELFISSVDIGMHKVLVKAWVA